MAFCLKRKKKLMEAERKDTTENRDSRTHFGLWREFFEKVFAIQTTAVLHFVLFSSFSSWPLDMQYLTRRDTS